MLPHALTRRGGVPPRRSIVKVNSSSFVQTGFPRGRVVLFVAVVVFTFEVVAGRGGVGIRLRVRRRVTLLTRATGGRGPSHIQQPGVLQHRVGMRVAVVLALRTG